MTERPRDPGTADYEVIYSHILSSGKRMRTIITKPRKAGTYPGFFFIQGFSPVSYDFTLQGSTGSVQQLNGPLLHKMAGSGFVTIRVEKPGVGDSEGGPFNDLDYNSEIDIYRQALLQLKSQKEVDQDNLFIFGHSMGGAFGPMIANEIKVKGIAVYGTAARTWHEYLLDTIRYQGLLAGGTHEAADDEVRTASRLMALVFHEGMSAEDVKKAHPELAAYTDAIFPGGRFNGKALEFWRQLGKINFAKYWAGANTRVLAVHGATDFVAYPVCHQLIADVVNKKNPGWGRFASAPESDHLFHKWSTEAESQRNFGKGSFNLAFTEMMLSWMKEVMAEKN
jgi:pimeloyl-ACP methyl ester carboxylesterase